MNDAVVSRNNSIEKLAIKDFIHIFPNKAIIPDFNNITSLNDYKKFIDENIKNSYSLYVHLKGIKNIKVDPLSMFTESSKIKETINKNLTNNMSLLRNDTVGINYNDLNLKEEKNNSNNINKYNLTDNFNNLININFKQNYQNNNNIDNKESKDNAFLLEKLTNKLENRSQAHTQIQKSKLHKFVFSEKKKDKIPSPTNIFIRNTNDNSNNFDYSGSNMMFRPKLGRKISNCPHENKPHHAKGMCRSCYQRYYFLKMCKVGYRYNKNSKENTKNQYKEKVIKEVTREIENINANNNDNEFDISSTKAKYRVSDCSSESFDDIELIKIDKLDNNANNSCNSITMIDINNISNNASYSNGYSKNNNCNSIIKNNYNDNDKMNTSYNTNISDKCITDILKQSKPKSCNNKNSNINISSFNNSQKKSSNKKIIFATLKC